MNKVLIFLSILLVINLYSAQTVKDKENKKVILGKDGHGI